MGSSIFSGKDFITVEGMGRPDVDAVFVRADEMGRIVKDRGATDLLKGKMLAALFYEPSSRTFSSFITAMQRLGGGIIPLNGMTNTSVVKGETLADTVRVFSAYADALVIRHPDPGALAAAAKYATVPVINAGEGATGEHPTQGLIDLYTVTKHFPSVEKLHVLIIGDLAHYRPTNSLTKLLALYPGVRLTLATPADTPIHEGVRQYLKAKNVRVEERTDFTEALSTADVLYVTRVKKEYMSDELYKKIKGSYIVNGDVLAKMKKESIILHCLPRIDEIASEVDDDPRALYIGEQVKNGLFVRMALLSLILKKD